MIRVRPGTLWERNPEYLQSLVALAEGRSRGFSPRHIVDVIALEVDGVDLAQGRFEAPLIDALGALLEGANRILRQEGEVDVVPPGAALRIRLLRGDEGTRLQLIHAAEGDALPPLEVNPRGLWTAVCDAAAELHASFVRIHPGLAEVRGIPELLAPRPRLSEGERTGPSWLVKVQAGQLSLAVSADKRWLHVLDSEGLARWTGPAERALRALAMPDPSLPDVRWNARLGTVRFGRAPSVSRSLLAMALVELQAALPAFSGPEGEVLEELAGLEGGGALETFEAPAEVHAQAPALPRAGLRRVMLQRAWRVELEGEIRHLQRFQEGLLLIGSGDAQRRAADGRLIWRSPLEAPSFAGDSANGWLITGDSRHRVVLIDAATGERRGDPCDIGLNGPPTVAAVASEGGKTRIFVTDGLRMVALDPAGDALWAFERTRPHLVAAVGDGVVIAGEDGALYGVRLNGSLAWQTTVEMPDVAMLQPDERREGLVAATADRRILAFIRASDGALLWQKRPRGVISAPVLLEGKLFVARRSKRSVLLSAWRVANGEEAWERSLPGGEEACLVADGERVYLARSGGRVAAFTPDGRLLYDLHSEEGKPALASAAPQTPTVGAGLLLVPGNQLRLLEAASGRWLASIPRAQAATSACLMLDGPLLVTTNLAGVVEAWRLRGHLRVVEDDTL